MESNSDDPCAYAIASPDNMMCRFNATFPQRKRPQPKGETRVRQMGGSTEVEEAPAPAVEGAKDEVLDYVTLWLEEVMGKHKIFASDVHRQPPEGEDEAWGGE